MAWLRTGDCCRCGDCCRGNPFTGEAGGYCPLARPRPDGTVMCSDRLHPYYLGGCRDWPSEPEHIADKPRCSYRFEWREP